MQTEQEFQPGPEQTKTDYAGYYLALKEMCKTHPTPKLQQEFITTQNTILAYWGPDALAQIDPDQPTLVEFLQMQSLDDTKPVA